MFNNNEENYKKENDIKINDNKINIDSNLEYNVNLLEENSRLIKESLELNKENNLLLKKIRSYQKWLNITKFIYWGLIIMITFGFFTFLKSVKYNVNDINYLKDLFNLK